jgi:hypothetical protein
MQWGVMGDWDHPYVTMGKHISHQNSAHPSHFSSFFILSLQSFSFTISLPFPFLFFFFHLRKFSLATSKKSSSILPGKLGAVSALSSCSTPPPFTLHFLSFLLSHIFLVLVLLFSISFYFNKK